MRATIPTGLAVALFAGGCVAPTTEINGLTAVGVDREGRPQILAAVCSGTLDTVTVSGDREGLAEDEPNPELATWTTPEAATSEVVLEPHRLDGWEGTPGFDFEERRGYIVTASSSGQDAQAGQVSFDNRQLAALAPEEVLVRDARTWPREDFAARACPGSASR